MTTVKPVARPLLGMVLFAALAVYAALALSHALAPSGASITLTQTTQTVPAKNANGAVHSAPLPAATGAQQSVDQAPVDHYYGTPFGNGTQRFADTGPGIVAPAAPTSAQSCSPKLCPRPQR